MLEWSEWHPWPDVERDVREQGGVAIAPNEQPGVYEAQVGYAIRTERLIIGRSEQPWKLRIGQWY